MTTSRAEERRRVAEGDEAWLDTIAGAIAVTFQESLPVERPPWPAIEYQDDPDRFGREILGVQLTSEQREIADAIRECRRVAVVGGRKVGKDFVLAVVAIWFYACFPGARVRFTAVKAAQVDDIFWRELRKILQGHGRCLACKRSNPTGPRPCPHSKLMPEAQDIAILARTGLKSPDFREIVGYTAREAEAAAGVSGAAQLYIVDEASGVEDHQIEAIEGNLAGSSKARLALISNGTRTEGQFYRAFHEEAEQWKTFQLSSVEIAKKYGGRIPGIANLDEIRGLIEKYGAKSDWVRVHLLGLFPEKTEGRIFDLETIKQSIEARATASAEGDLYIGVDCAGESGTGDESGFSARRGLRQLSLETRSGLTSEQHLGHVQVIIERYPQRNQRIVVIIDRGGEPGSRVWGVFIAHRQALWENPPFDLIGVDSSRKAHDAKAYAHVRDELVANLHDWVRSGGAIVDDAKLHVELYTFRWAERRFDNEPSKLVDKKIMRAKLGRSPDRADATALSVWGERHWRPDADAPAAAEASPPEYEQTGDVYADADAAQRMMREAMMGTVGRGR